MTDATVVVMVAALPATIGSMTSAFLAFAAWQKSLEIGHKTDVTSEAVALSSAKTDKVIEKAAEIHTLANANFNKATSQLEVAQATIQGLQRLLDISERAKSDAAVASATILEAALVAPARNSSHAPVHVLLVEDSVTDTALFRHALPAEFVVVSVGSLGAAVDYLRRNPMLAQIAVVDLGLPDAFGLDAIVAMHATVASLPIIVLSGSVDEKLEGQARALGAVDVFGKNPTVTALPRVVAALRRCAASIDGTPRGGDA